jgi:hypothetical protein
MDRFSPPDDRRPLRIMPDKLDEPAIDGWKIRRDMALEDGARKEVNEDVGPDESQDGDREKGR